MQSYLSSSNDNLSLDRQKENHILLRARDHRFFLCGIKIHPEDPMKSATIRQNEIFGLKIRWQWRGEGYPDATIAANRGLGFAIASTGNKDAGKKQWIKSDKRNIQKGHGGDQGGEISNRVGQTGWRVGSLTLTSNLTGEGEWRCV